jgi:hypothetical protein
LKTQNKHH